MADIVVPLTKAECKKLKHLVGMIQSSVYGWDTTGPSGEDMADGWRREVRKIAEKCVSAGGPKQLGMTPARWEELGL